MKDNESVKDYSGILIDVVNQMRLLGKTFEDHKVVEKNMMSVPQKFEAKISVIEEFYDLQYLTIAKLISKLYVQEQRVQMRDDVVVEGAFQANNKGRSTGNLPRKKPVKFSKGKTRISLRRQIFSPCSYCRRTNHAEKDFWFKDKPSLQCMFCNNLGHSEKYYRIKKKQSQQQIKQEVNVFEEGKDDEEHLFMASQTCNTFELNTWLIDSGCTSHMTKFLSIFSFIDRSVQLNIKLGNGDIVQAKGKCTLAVRKNRGTKTITNVLYISELDQNLFSVAQMLRNGYQVSLKIVFALSLIHMI
jgi:hypothetical protein